MALEKELLSLEVVQAQKKLTFIQAFLPDEILSKDQEPLQLHLTLDRLVVKSKLIMNHLQSFYKLDQISFNLINDVELSHEYEELLFVWELYWVIESKQQIF